MRLCLDQGKQDVARDFKRFKGNAAATHNFPYCLPTRLLSKKTILKQKQSMSKNQRLFISVLTTINWAKPVEPMFLPRLNQS